ncbi:unnamed protein product, partial [Ixodes pacificus]
MPGPNCAPRNPRGQPSAHTHVKDNGPPRLHSGSSTVAPQEPARPPESSCLESRPNRNTPKRSPSRGNDNRGVNPDPSTAQQPPFLPVPAPRTLATTELFSPPAKDTVMEDIDEFLDSDAIPPACRTQDQTLEEAIPPASGTQDQMLEKATPPASGTQDQMLEK